MTLATFNSLDVKSIGTVHDGTIIYTTPNMTFIPEPHNDEEELCAQADGCFGVADYFQWLQMYCNQYRYAICICRKEDFPPPEPLSWVWYRPTLKDFEPLANATFQVGKLKQEKGLGITSLLPIVSQCYKEWKNMCGDKQDIASQMVKSLQHDIMLLLNHPLTFHDIIVFIAQAQQHFLNILAFLNYVMYIQPCIAHPSGPPVPVWSHWLGCFT